MGLMIDPKELDISTLPWLPLEAKSAFPRQPAIYFAMDSNDVIQYIGRSINPKQRWVNHHKYNDLQKIGEIKIVYLFVDNSELLPEVELALIEWFNPQLNSTLHKCKQPKKINKNSISLKCYLKELCEAENLTQKDLAARTGLSPTTVGSYYRGTVTRFDKETLESLAIFLNLESISELIEFIND